MIREDSVHWLIVADNLNRLNIRTGEVSVHEAKTGVTDVKAALLQGLVMAGGAVAGAAETSDGSKYRKVSDATGAYVFEYSRNAVQATGTYVSGTTYYTDATCTTTVDTSSFTASTDVSSYYLAPAVKVYKVIKVVAE